MNVQVGNYKLTADQKKRAEKARSEVERKAWKNKEEDRNTKIQERKEKKQQEELVSSRQLSGLIRGLSTLRCSKRATLSELGARDQLAGQIV